ncbi:hypothetical protein AB0L40_09185 [Patulibacter sp. NPDC049589]|uniref:hypothetical protein n=1 Tax=Patulibacter sp. NPDC049589 TaxID=3154731 RepID=UPI003419E64A
MTLPDELAQLHILRTRGLVLADQVTDPATMAALEADGLVLRNRHGLVLTPPGYRRHRRMLSDLRSTLPLDVVRDAYAAFVAANPIVEDACVAWQLSSREVGTAREISRMLRDGLAGASRPLDRAGVAVPHLAPYPDRLRAALTMSEHDRRFLTSPAVDSFHSVWFQLEEDLLVTLGLERPEDDGHHGSSDLHTVLPSAVPVDDGRGGATVVPLPVGPGRDPATPGPLSSLEPPPP